MEGWLVRRQLRDRVVEWWQGERAIREGFLEEVTSKVRHKGKKNCNGMSKEMVLLHGFDPWGGKNPWRRAWQPTLIFLPGKSHGQRSLVGYSP